MEVRKGDGDRYPPATLRNMLSGLNREMQKNKGDFSIMDKADRRFRELHLTLDSVCSEFCRSGVGVSHNSARVISLEDENIFWREGCFGNVINYRSSTHSFLLCWHAFCAAWCSRAARFIDKPIRSSPCRQGYLLCCSIMSILSTYQRTISTGSKIRRPKTKVVKAYAQPGLEWCIVKLLDLYLPLLPVGSTHFYLRRSKSFPSDSSQPAFNRQRVGINQLKKIVTTISSAAGVSGYTNHCLRATAMTRMYNQGIPDEK